MPVATVEYHPCQNAPGCRVSLAYSAAMPAVLSRIRYAGYAPAGQPAMHHRFRPIGTFRAVGQWQLLAQLPGNQSIVQRRRRAAGQGAALPLQPHAALLHKAAFWQVPGSRCAKAPLGARHRFAPFGLSKQALCKVAFAGYGCVSRPRFPVAGAPYARSPEHPCGVLGFGYSVWRFALGFGQWPAAMFHPTNPRPPQGPAASRQRPWRGCPIRPQGGSHCRAPGRLSALVAPLP